jgi:Tol biopolymer transport system component
MRTGRDEIWKVPAGGGPAQQVTKNGGWAALESPDGRYLYYTKSERSEGGLWRMPVEGGPEERVVQSVRPRDFSIAGQNLYYAHNENGKVSIFGFDLVSRSNRRLFVIPQPTWMGLSVSPDQRSILYSQYDRYGSDLMLVETFR